MKPKVGIDAVVSENAAWMGRTTAHDAAVIPKTISPSDDYPRRQPYEIRAEAWTDLASIFICIHIRRMWVEVTVKWETTSIVKSPYVGRGP